MKISHRAAAGTACALGALLLGILVPLPATAAPIGGDLTGNMPLGSPAAAPLPSATPPGDATVRRSNAWWLAATLWGLALPAAWLFSGLSGRLRDWAQRALAAHSLRLRRGPRAAAPSRDIVSTCRERSAGRPPSTLDDDESNEPDER